MRSLETLALTLCLALSAAACGPRYGGTGGGGGAQTGTVEPTSSAGPPEGWGAADTWRLPSRTGVDTSTLSARITNPYLPFSPGASWTYAGDTEEGTETNEVAVLAEQRPVMGVTCTVVSDKVSRGGELVEDTRDWYAQDREGNVWYMGEAVDNYENGKLVDHEGSWEAGVEGALPGIIMWAQPQITQPPYYQEFREGEAEDIARDVSTDGTATVPAGSYTGLLVIEEWTPLEPGIVSLKYYARGVGNVREESVRGPKETGRLTRYKAP